ncbi:MAG: hypothetical protein JNN08_14580 [Bryobacterales bacterium]|nr:hypothetical protein [Bryobacterales bacterium]
MHAGFPCLTPEINGLLRIGAEEAKLDRILDRAGGTLLAHGMATLLTAAFCVVMRSSLVSRSRARKAEEFFRENFEIRDPDAPGGFRYYQGKILIRTTRPEDNMNVYLRFCPDPRKLFRTGLAGSAQAALLGTALDPTAVVSTQTLNEMDADALQKDTGRVDLVINFKDVKSIVGLVCRPKVDIGELLIENVVRMKGNVGHLFKFGAIAKNIELALGRA